MTKKKYSVKINHKHSKEDKKMSFNIPQAVSKAISILENNNYEAYIVGGCVRDILMGKEPHDYDICTQALPEQTIQVFSGYKVIETGLKHGTVTVLIDGYSLEITTFRTDGEYSDNRHPTCVEFVSDIKDALSRRDFTINAMAYSQKSGLVDFYGGQADIEAGIIRCVGDPDTRFKEDALRIMRALRFSSQLYFNIEKSTSESILKNRELLKNISAERIASELNKLLIGDKVFDVLTQYRDVIAVFIPEFIPCFDMEQYTKHHCYTVYDHIIKSVEHVPKDKVLRLTMLLHDIAKPQCFYKDSNGGGHFKGHQLPGADKAREILHRLKYDNDTIHEVVMLVKEHDNRYPAEEKSVKRFMSKYGYDFFIKQLKVRRADTLAQSMYMREQKLAQLDKTLEIGKKIIEDNKCFKLSDLAVNGKDLISIGIENGREIGRILDVLLDLVISEKAENNKIDLLKIAQNMKQ